MGISEKLIGVFAATFALSACSGSEGTPQDAGQTPSDTGISQIPDTGVSTADCVPIESAFATNAQPILESRCSKCHGETPDFGAPMSLVTYDDLIAVRDGIQVAKTVAERVATGWMPPQGEPDLEHTELDTLAAWSSCGVIHPDPIGNLEATAPVHVAPDEPPADATRLELTAQEFSVGPNVRDQYERFTFRNIVASDAFIRRIESVVDDSRVLHHVTLTYSNGDYLYAWAPGGGPAQFPEGGLRIRPSDVFEVEIHYNNGAAVEGVRDSSGVAIYYSEPVGTEYVQLSPQTWNIQVPANSTASASVDCMVTSDFTMFAGMPHMHQIGSTFSTVLIRQNGEEVVVNSLTGWSFDAQRYYDYGGVQAVAGDRLVVTCGYDNPTNATVRAGLGTADEMCFDFIYATPATAALNCPRF